MTAAVQFKIAVSDPETRVPFDTWLESFLSLHPDGAAPANFGNPDNPSSYTAKAKASLASLLAAGTPGGYRAYGALIGEAPEILNNSGAGASHDNMQPVLVVNFIIALQGVYPSRN